MYTQGPVEHFQRQAVEHARPTNESGRLEAAALTVRCREEGKVGLVGPPRLSSQCGAVRRKSNHRARALECEQHVDSVPSGRTRDGKSETRAGGWGILHGDWGTHTHRNSTPRGRPKHHQNGPPELHRRREPSDRPVANAKQVRLQFEKRPSQKGSIPETSRCTSRGQAAFRRCVSVPCNGQEPPVPAAPEMLSCRRNRTLPAPGARRSFAGATTGLHYPASLFETAVRRSSPAWQSSYPASRGA